VKVYYHQGGVNGNVYPGDWLMCTGVAGIEASDSNYTDAGGDVAYIRTLEVRDNTYYGDGPPADYGDILIWSP